MSKAKPEPEEPLKILKNKLFKKPIVKKGEEKPTT